MCKRRHIAVLLFSLFRPSCCNDVDYAETVIIITLVGSPGTLALQFPLTANSSDKTVTVVVFLTVTEYLAVAMESAVDVAAALQLTQLYCRHTALAVAILDHIRALGSQLSAVQL